ESAQTPSRLAMLHDEIARLPLALRQALVLCLLEGKTHIEAAQEIGCGEATIRRSLSAARDRLKKRLKTDPSDSPQLAPTLVALSPRLLQSTVQLTKGTLTPLATAVLREMTGGQLMKIATLGVLIATTFVGAAVVFGLKPETTAAPATPPQPQKPHAAAIV